MVWEPEPVRVLALAQVLELDLASAPVQSQVSYSILALVRAQVPEQVRVSVPIRSPDPYTEEPLFSELEQVLPEAAPCFECVSCNLVPCRASKHPLHPPKYSLPICSEVQFWHCLMSQRPMRMSAVYL